MASKDQNLPDIAFHLNQLGETTTAAELVRSKGQSRKLKVISERKLMDWILALLQQHMASKVDAFSDEEKQQLVAKAQEELQKRLKLQQELESEKARVNDEYKKTLTTLENSKKSQQDYETAIAALKERLEKSEQAAEDLRLDNEDLHDQLAEKMALLSTTIDEKNRDRNKLQTTLRNHMVRSTGLVEGVLGLDATYYGSRHQESSPVPDEASDEEQFFHDFDIGAAVINTLSGDLEKLRDIVKTEKAKKDDPRNNLLESDLALLKELKSGSLAAVDVAQPIEGLVEALEGARSEAAALEQAAAEAVGVSGHQQVAISSPPDADGKPAEVIAGTAAIIRELGAVLARERQRLGALRHMADEADHARTAGESELEALRAAHEELLGAVAAKAKERKVDVPKKVTDPKAPAADRRQAAIKMLDEFKGGGDPEQLRDLAAQLRDLAKSVFTEEEAKNGTASFKAGASTLKELDAALAAYKPHDDGTAKILASALSVSRSLQRDASKQSDRMKVAKIDMDKMRADNESLASNLESANKELSSLRHRATVLGKSEREIAEEIIKAAKGDNDLADSAAELSLSLENLSDDPNTHTDLTAHTKAATALLVKRKQDLTKQIEQLRKELDKAKQTEGSAAEKLKQDIADLTTRNKDATKALEEARAALAKAKSDQEALTAERDEMALGGKEVIQQLTQQRDARTQELQALAKSEKELRQSQAESQKRLQHFDQATRELIETVASLLPPPDAGDTKAMQNARAKFEKALTNVPGEVDVMMKPEVVRDLAESSQALLEHFKDRAQSLNKQVSAQKDRLAAAEKERDELAEKHKKAKEQLAEAQEQIKSLESERDEMALSGKEIITQLTQQRDARTKELEAARKSESAAKGQLTGLVHAQAANRNLAEALAALAAAEAKLAPEIGGLGEVEEPRVDLESALSELPDEGEENVAIPADLGLRLSKAAKQLADGMKNRRAKIVSHLSDSQAALAKSLRTLGMWNDEGADVKKVMASDEVSRALTKLDNAAKADADQLVHASQTFATTIKDRIKNLASELATARQELASNRGNVEKLQSEAASSKAALVSNQHALEEARAELEKSKANSKEAEAALRNIAGVISQIAGERPTTRKKKSDPAIPVETVIQGTIETVNNLTAAVAKDRDERDYLSKQLKKVDADNEKAKKDLAAKEADLAGLEKELGLLRANEQKLSQTATELSKELLITAKAVIADTDPKQAQKLQQTLAGFDKIDPQQALAAAVGVVPAMREGITSQAIDVAELRSTISSAEEQKNRELDELRKQIDALRKAVDEAKQDAARARSQQDALAKKAADSQKISEETAAALKKAQEDLRQAGAEVEEFRARGDESSGTRNRENTRLKQELAEEQKNKENLERSLAELTERLEASEARLNKQREEFSKLIEARDEVILQKDQELDARGASKIDAKSLEAEIATLRKELAAAHEKLTEFQQLYGEHAGDAARSGDLAKELKLVQAERNAMRDKNRQIESELADAAAHAEEMRASLEERRKELQALRDKQAKELASERDKANELREESRKLKEEVVGLRARVRRLSENA